MRRRAQVLRGGFDPSSVDGFPEPFEDDYSLPTGVRRRRWDEWMSLRQGWLAGRARAARRAGWTDATEDDFAALGDIPDMPLDGSEI